jgi:hypothetical protein
MKLAKVSKNFLSEFHIYIHQHSLIYITNCVFYTQKLRIYSPHQFEDVKVKLQDKIIRNNLYPESLTLKYHSREIYL